MSTTTIQYLDQLPWTDPTPTPEQTIAAEIDAALENLYYVRSWANLDAPEADSLSKGITILKELTKALRT